MTNTEYHNSEKAILKTLLYSDIFHFPLSKDEIWDFLIAKKIIDRVQFEKALDNLTGNVLQKKQGLYCLKGCVSDIAKRQKNTKYVKQKFLVAQKAAYYLSYVPTISFIGLSGGAAVGNVEAKDDVDLFIIAKKGTLFMTRLLVVLLLEMIGMRRKRNSGENAVSDKICTNLFIDDASLAWPGNKHNVYIAHEIAQVKPLFERDDMYEKFISANQWVRKFLPNSTQHVIATPWENNFYAIKLMSRLLLTPSVEQLAKRLQKSLMRKHRTNETISDKMLAFHPRDYRRETMQLFEAKCQAFHLLTTL